MIGYCITGCEPLLRNDFFEIMNYAYSLGFILGMTNNATLIEDAVAEKLEKSRMPTISVNADDMRGSYAILLTEI